MNTRKKRLPILLLVFITLTIVWPGGLMGCQSAQPHLARRLKVAGSTTVEPAAQTAAQAFMVHHPDVQVIVRGGGSSLGVKGVAYGALHVGMASRSLKESELEKWPNLTTTVVGRDGVSVVVHPDLYQAGVRQLTLEQVADIWQGEITNWNQVGGPDLEIQAFDKALVHGTRATFGKIVLGGEDAEAPGTIGTLGENETIIATVSEYPAAVSILSTGWKTDQVVAVPIVNGDGEAVEPTTENVANGRYPILRDLNLITDGPPQGLAAEFIQFMLSPKGQTIVEQAGYSPVSQ